jgi:hypothetical protein
VKFRFLRDYGGRVSKQRLCRALGVSRSGLYASVFRSESARVFESPAQGLSQRQSTRSSGGRRGKHKRFGFSPGNHGCPFSALCTPPPMMLWAWNR